MILEKIFSHGKKERQVTEDIEGTSSFFARPVRSSKTPWNAMIAISCMKWLGLKERRMPVRRDVISHIYEGAFLPYIRPDLCKFVEIVDEVFDALKDTALLQSGF